MKMQHLLHRYWFLLPVGLFVGLQLFSFIVLLVNKDAQVAFRVFDGYQYFVPPQSANPPWHEFISQWNGFGYEEIARNGYPTVLPTFDDGAPAPSPWAFFPLFPILCSFLMATGLSFGYSAALISLTFSLAGVTLLFKWLYSFSGTLWVPTVAVSSLLLWPAAPLFQLGYAEATAFFFIVAILMLVDKGKYLQAIPLVFLLGLTRPVGVPDFLIFSAHGAFIAHAWLKAHPGEVRAYLQSSKRIIRDTWKYFVLLASSGVATLLWPVIGIIVTGENAYFKAREGYAPGEFESWLTTNPLESTASYPWGTLPYLILLTAWAGYMLCSKQFRATYPLMLRLWTLVLVLYVFTVTSPVGNEWRYLLLGLFVAPVLRRPQGKAQKIAFGVLLALLVAGALYCQQNWIVTHWIDDGGLRKNV